MSRAKSWSIIVCRATNAKVVHPYDRTAGCVGLFAEDSVRGRCPVWGVDPLFQESFSMATRCSGLSWMVWTWLPSGSWTVARSMLSSTGLFIAPHRWGEARPVLRNQGLRRKTEQRQCDKVRPQVRFRLPPTVITVATLLLWWRTNARSMAGGRYRPGGSHVDRGRRGVHAWVQPDGEGTTRGRR